MRIVHLGKYYPPRKGGMETVLFNLCTEHTDRAEVTALVANGQRGTIQEMMAGVRVIRVGCVGMPLSVPITPTLPGWLRRVSADVLVHHEPNPVALFSYLLVRPAAPLVIWFHSDIVRQRIFYGAYRRFLRQGLRRARMIVVASPNHVAYNPLLREFAQKCCVIPFGIRLEHFSLVPEIGRRVAEIRGTSPLSIVLFVGRFSYYKGLEYLVDAMRSVPARLILVGSGPMEDKIRRQSAHVDTPGCIEFTGELTDEEVLAHLHACDVFVLPSVERSEAFGIVQLEAMACGKPVVSCRIPSGVPWVNQDGLTGFTVPPADSDALAAAMTRLLEDARLREKLGERARERVEREFTLERMGSAFWEVLVAAREGRTTDAYRYDPRDVVVVD